MNERESIGLFRFLVGWLVVISGMMITGSVDGNESLVSESVSAILER